jgi:hypothetical protein
MSDIQLLAIWKKQKNSFGYCVIPEVGALCRTDLDRMTVLVSDEIAELYAKQLKRIQP